MRDLVLSIDVGTQSTRALLFDTLGTLVAGARAVHDPAYHSPEYGWAEQDPGFYWDRVAQACRELFATHGLEAGRIASVAMTFQRGTIVNLGADGRPLRPAILWVDARRSSRPPQLPFVLTAAFNAVGVGPTVRRFQAETEVNWIAEHQPEIAARTAHQLLLSGWLTYRMTGLMRDSTAAIVAYLPFDYKKQTWAGPADWRWRAMAVRREALPELVAPGQQIGTVSHEAAAATGIPEGVPVIAAGSDKACEVLGAGCVLPHQGCIGYGTTATLNVSSPKYVEPAPFVPPYPSARPGHYDAEYQLSRGFWLVTHVLFTLPFMVRSVLAVMSSIDLTALEEAARSLGASFWQRMFHVVLPNSAGGIVAGSLMVLTLSLVEFNMTLLLHTPLTKTLPIGLADAYASLRIEVGSAYTVIFFMLIIPLLIALQRVNGRPR